MSTGKKGQSTLEYIILVTAVIVVILGFVGTRGGLFQTTMESTLHSATDKMPQTMDQWRPPRIPGQ